jgi:hypothetical protein
MAYRGAESHPKRASRGSGDRQESLVGTTDVPARTLVGNRPDGVADQGMSAVSGVSARGLLILRRTYSHTMLTIKKLWKPNASREGGAPGQN